VAEKGLIHSSSCSIFGICGGRGLVENVIWGERSWGTGTHVFVKVPRPGDSEV